MKELILSARRYLAEETWCPFFDGANVYVAIDADLIPYGAGFPCVGIKDGPIEYEHEDLVSTTATQEVDYIVYYEAASGAATHVGSHEALADGILGLTGNLRDALRDNFLGIEGMEQALPVRESEVETWASDGLLCLRKVLTMKYVRNTENA